MKKTIKWTALFAIIIAGGALVYFLNSALPIGTGYSAKYICSQVFLAGRDPGPVFENEVVPTHPLFKTVSFQVDYDTQTVTAAAFGFWKSMTAVYREGCGCTLAVDTDRDTLLAQAEYIPSHDILRRDLDWPFGHRVNLEALPKNVNPEKLGLAIEKAFAEPGPDTRRQTQAVVVVYKDRLIAEKYADGFTKDTPMLGWSMSKSVTAALAGILVKDGVLDLMENAPVKAWEDKSDPRNGITPDMMLRMSTGLEFQEEYAPFKDATYMLYTSHSMADYAASKPLKAPLDREWYYSSGTTNILARIIFDLTGQDLAAFTSFARNRLFYQIDAFSAVIEPDASGSFVGSSYMFATARDWARFGLLVKNDGKWGNRRILPEGFVDYLSTPAPGAPKGQYGAHFWLNAGEPGNPGERTFKSLPEDMVYMSGFNHQIVAVIPSLDLVAVRLGVTHDDSWCTETFLTDIIDAVDHSN